MPKAKTKDQENIEKRFADWHERIKFQERLNEELTVTITNKGINLLFPEKIQDRMTNEELLEMGAILFIGSKTMAKGRGFIIKQSKRNMDLLLDYSNEMKTKYQQP